MAADDTHNVFGAFAGLYDSFRPGYPNSLWQHIMKFVQPGDHVADVACGKAESYSAFAKKVNRVWSVRRQKRPTRPTAQFAA